MNQLYPIQVLNHDTGMYDYTLIDTEGYELDTGVSCAIERTHIAVVSNHGLRKPYVASLDSTRQQELRAKGAQVLVRRIGMVLGWSVDDRGQPDRPAVYVTVVDGQFVLVGSATAHLTAEAREALHQHARVRSLTTLVVAMHKLKGLYVPHSGFYVGKQLGFAV